MDAVAVVRILREIFNFRPVKRPPLRAERGVRKENHGSRVQGDSFSGLITVTSD